MIRIASAQVWVHDQEEALAFYTEKLGMEVAVRRHAARDGRLPLARRRARRPAGRLDRPDGDPRARRCSTPETAEQVRELMAQGRRRRRSSSPRTTAGPPTRSCAPAASSSSTSPRSGPYGIDCGFRDPSGNHLRLTQVREMANV